MKKNKEGDFLNLNNESIESLQQIYKKIYQNAVDLIFDGETLLEKGRLARSYLCFQIAIEEFGKLPMLNTIAVKKHNGEKIDWKKLNQRLRSHQKKNKMSKILKQFFYTTILMEKSKEPLLEISFEDLKKLFEEYKNDIMQNPSIFIMQQITGIIKGVKNIEEFEKEINNSNNKKNQSLYADFDGKDFLSPSDIIDEEDVKKIMLDAYFQRLIIELPKFHENGFVLFNKGDIPKEVNTVGDFTLSLLNQLESIDRDLDEQK